MPAEVVLGDGDVYHVFAEVVGDGDVHHVLAEVVLSDDVHHVLAEVVLCAVGRVAPLPADGDDGAKHCLARAGGEPPIIYKHIFYMEYLCFIINE